MTCVLLSPEHKVISVIVAELQIPGTSSVALVCNGDTLFPAVQGPARTTQHQANNAYPHEPEKGIVRLTLLPSSPACVSTLSDSLSKNATERKPTPVKATTIDRARHGGHVSGGVSHTHRYSLAVAQSALYLWKGFKHSTKFPDAWM